MKEILINRVKEQKQILLLENGELIEKYIEYDGFSTIEGNIYIGTVINTLKGMKTAFIDISQSKNAFIHFKDIMPKLNIKDNENSNLVFDSEKVKEGMMLLVQVKKDATETKGAKVSTHIKLDSRFVVLMPNTNIITISQKIEDEKEKERLLEISKKYLPEDCGIIVRTSAEKQEEEKIKRDIENVVEKWNNIKRIYEEKIKSEKFPKLIYKSHNIVKKIIVDLIDKDLKSIKVNDLKEYEYLKKILKEFEGNDINLKYEEKSDILNAYPTIREQILKTEKRKIWLKCGGFLAIDKTEALTAIDVNSGKYIGKDDVNKTIYKVNKEASIEIAKQLKLRDIGGIVIIDYIDMKLKEDKEKIQEILKEELKKDRAKTQVMGFSKLDLLEMTRKHICGN